MWDYWVGSVGDDSAGINSMAESLVNGLIRESKDQKVIKVTFFLVCHDEAAYRIQADDLKALTEEKLGRHVMTSLVPQAPIDGELSLEAWLMNEEDVKDIQRHDFPDGQFLMVSGIHTVLIVQAFALSGKMRSDAETCFSRIDQVIKANGFELSRLFRSWNYIGEILELEEEKQNYQVFNEARSDYFMGTQFVDGYPAATGIGMDIPGLIIEACFVDSKQLRSFGISNPVQRPAHQYSNKVLVSKLPKKSTPKFERARVLVNHQHHTLFVSGTAAIIGEDSSTSMSPEEQTRQTIEIISKLIARENVLKFIDLDVEEFNYKHVRVYLKDGYISTDIRNQIAEFFKYAQPLYLTADVCRDNLLVEIEAELEGHK